MVVCQYFLRGQCRFGDNCRNEHPRQSGFGNQSWANNNAQSKPSSLLFTQDTMKSDLFSDKPIWPLSCYGPAKHEPNIIAGLDESMEELRVRAVLALKAGNSNEYTSYESSKIQAADQVFTNTRNNLASAYQAAANQSAHGNKQSATTSASTSTSAFGPSSTTSAFGQSAFGSSSTQQQSPFGQPTSTLQSTFGSTASSAFNKPPTSSATFGQSSFGQPQQPSAFGSMIKPASGAFSAFANAGSSPFAAAAAAANQNKNQNQSGAGGGTSVGGGGGFAAFAGQPSTFSTGATNTASGSSTGSVFGSGGGGTTVSGFGAPAPAFGQPSQPQSAFGALQSQSTSVFGQPSQPQTQQQSAFGSPTTQPQSAFGQSQTQPQSAFGALTTQPQSAFGAPSAFGQPSAFGSTNNSGIGTSNPLNTQPTQSSVFTPLSNPTNPLNTGAPQQSPFNSNPLGNTPPAQPFGAFTSGSTAPNPFTGGNNNAPINTNANPFTSTTTLSTFSSTPLAPSTSANPLVNPTTKPNFSLLLTKVKATPGLTPYDSLLPPDYTKVLPEGVLEAFKKESFEFGKVPDWVPPVDMR